MVALLPKKQHEAERLQHDDSGLTKDQSKLHELLESVKSVKLANLLGKAVKEASNFIELE